MPTYVYGCDDKEHMRIEIIHGMIEDPTIICGTCGQQMHRIPQAVEHYHNPFYTLLDHMDKRYTDWRMRRKKGLIKG
jgi:hypothetical protein